MAVKPLIGSMTPWDATTDYNINFTYSGALPVSNRMIVYNAANMEVVYDDREVTPRFSHRLSANTLMNGMKYAVQIEVTESTGEISPISDKAYFWCLKQPDFYYSSPAAEVNIQSSNILLNLAYSQEDGELLYSYRHSLYDNSKTEVSTSDMFYNSEGLEYSFRGLKNHNTYYIRSVGVTKNGINLDTGYLRFFVNYENQETFHMMNTESDDNATVTGYTNMVSVDADGNQDDYVILASYVQLVDNSLTYSKGFKVAEDFTCSLKITKLRREEQLLEMFNGEGENIRLLSIILEDGEIMYRLIVNNGLTDYNLFSEPMMLSDDDNIIVHIRRKNNIYLLNVQYAA